MDPGSIPGFVALFKIIDEAAASADVATMIMLLGALDAARGRCLRVLGDRISGNGQCDEPSQASGPAAAASAIVRGDRWLSPKEGAARLGRSVRWLYRRAHKPPFASFCIPQEKRGFMVSELGLADHMRRELERARR
jgi:hypothetical protein